MALLSRRPGGPEPLLPGLSGDFGRRFAVTIGLLVVCALGDFVPLPGIDPAFVEAAAMPHGDVFRQMINAVGGGFAGRVSIFALGLTPYLSASILVHLLGLLVRPLGLRRATAAGRLRLESHCRLLTLPLAFAQGWAIAHVLMSQPGVVAHPAEIFVPLAAATLTGGVCALLWLASLISERGVGQGVALIFFAAVAAHLPATVSNAVEIVRQGAVPAWTLAAEFGAPLAVLVLAVFFDGAERRLPVDGAPVGSATPEARARTYLPVRLNAGGVLAATILAAILPFSFQLAGHPGDRPDDAPISIVAVLAAQFALVFLFGLFAATRTDAPGSGDGHVDASRAALPASTAEAIAGVRIRLAIILALTLALIVLAQEILRGFDIIVIFVNTASLLILAWVGADLAAKARGYRSVTAR